MLLLKYLQLPFFFDAQRLQEDLNRLAVNNWQLHYQTLHFKGDWSAIPLRSINGSADNIMISPREDEAYADTPYMKACPYIQESLSVFKCPLKAVRFLKLASGSVINEHRDADLNYEKGEIRVHIPVITNPGIEFFLDHEKMILKEGECWYMNFNLPHSINNKSEFDRIHLVIDATVNDWVKELFSSETIVCKKEVPAAEPDRKTKEEMIFHLRRMNTEAGNKLADELEASLKE